MAINWQDVFTAIGGQAAFLGMAGWLIKSLVSDRMARDADVFKTRLKSDADAEIERLKNSLQMVALEHQVRFSKLHERRAEVIAELYKLLQETTWVAQGFIYQGTSSPSEEDRAGKKVSELYRFIELHRLYLPSSVCTLLENFVGKLKHSVIHVSLYWSGIDILPTSPEWVEKKNEVMRAAITALENDIPALRRELETEFRKLLGVENGTHQELTP